MVFTGHFVHLHDFKASFLSTPAASTSAATISAPTTHASSAPAKSASIRATFSSRPGLIDDQSPSLQFLTVQCSLSLTGRRHLHKSKSFRWTSVFVIDDIDGFNLARWFKCLPQVQLGNLA
jgi:hypothetical protein